MPSSLRGNVDPGARIRVAPENVTIESWPLRERPLENWSFLALAGGAGALVGWTSGSETLGWIAAFVLILTLWRVWIPVTWEFNARGMLERKFGRKRRIAWSAIRRCEVYRRGVLLLPDAVVNSLAPLRGVYVPWGDQRPALLASLEYYLHPAAGPPSHLPYTVPLGEAPRRDAIDREASTGSLPDQVGH
jgi:hypothetical protein